MTVALCVKTIIPNTVNVVITFFENIVGGLNASKSNHN